MALWLGPIFSFIFIWLTWMITGPSLLFTYNAVNWYLTIPSMGMSLFAAAMLVNIYEKIPDKNILRTLAVAFIFGIIFIFYQNSKVEINQDILAANPQLIKVTDQLSLHRKLIDKINTSQRMGNTLLYFEIPDGDLSQYYKEALVWQNFGNWIHFIRTEGITNNGCIGGIFNKEILKTSIKVENNTSGFLYNSKCVNKNAKQPEKRYFDKISFYPLENFYAFKIKDGNFEDIKKKILKDLHP